MNLSDRDDRRDCRATTEELRIEGRQLCAEQRDARLDLCSALNAPAEVAGDTRYDPDFELIDPPIDANPYFPLAVGSKWVYEDDEGVETTTVEVLNKTKSIEDQTCVVVSDIVEEDGDTIEDTNDWYGHTEDGDVIYCGEIAEELETNEDDNPPEPELVDIEGSWKWGRDSDKPGVLMFAAPQIGDVYRQEFSLGNAEDVAAVLHNAYTFGNGDLLDEFVPEEAEELMVLCGAGCVVTKDSTPIEPEVFELKFYAPGTGVILEVDPDPEDGGFVMLTGCNLPGSGCPALP